MTQAASAAAPAASNRTASSGICARGVTVTYANGHTALRDASFETPAGSITALVGVNGSGKSTLFKAVMGFVPLSAGQVQVLGLPVAQAMRQRLMAYVPQSEEVDWNFPVLVQDVVMMGRYGHMGFMRLPRQADRAAVRQALERVDMSALAGPQGTRTLWEVNHEIVLDTIINKCPFFQPPRFSIVIQV